MINKMGETRVNATILEIKEAARTRRVAGFGMDPNLLASLVTVVEEMTTKEEGNVINLKTKVRVTMGMVVDFLMMAGMVETPVETITPEADLVETTEVVIEVVIDPKEYVTIFEIIKTAVSGTDVDLATYNNELNSRKACF